MIAGGDGSAVAAAASAAAASSGNGESSAAASAAASAASQGGYCCPGSFNGLNDMCSHQLTRLCSRYASTQPAWYMYMMTDYGFSPRRQMWTAHVPSQALTTVGRIRSSCIEPCGIKGMRRTVLVQVRAAEMLLPRQQQPPLLVASEARRSLRHLADMLCRTCVGKNMRL